MTGKVNGFISRLLDVDTKGVILDPGQIPSLSEIEEKLDYFCTTWKYEKKEKELVYIAKNKLMAIGAHRSFAQKKDQISLDEYDAELRYEAASELLLKISLLILLGTEKHDSED